MKSLIKIRAKYLLRHKCGFFCSYLLIPLLIFTSLFGGFDNSKGYITSIIRGVKIEEKINLLDNDNFTEFQNIFTIVTENKEDCDILSNLIYKKKTSSLRCVTKESDITDNTQNIIKIINDKGKYNIELIEIVEANNYYDENDLILTRFVFKYEQYLDQFYYENCGDMSHYQPFLKIQSLFAQFLIQKEKGKNNKKITLNLGNNGYPPYREHYHRDTNKGIIGNVTIFTIVICLQFSMSTYFLI